MPPLMAWDPSDELSEDGEDLFVDDGEPLEDLPPESQIDHDVAAIARRNKDIFAEDIYRSERDFYQGLIVPIRDNKRKSTVEWRVEDLSAEEQDEFNQDEDEDLHEAMFCGVSAFDFTKYEVTDNRGRASRVNLMKLFFLLWPGDVKQQLLMMNARISRDNNARRKHIVSPVSLREFATFLGLMLVARIEGKRGADLWQGSAKEGEGYHSQIDVSGYMSSHCHGQIRRYFSFMFANESLEEIDPWWQVEEGIRGFNNVRQAVVRSHSCKVLDEIMSAYKPRTTPTGKCSMFKMQHSIQKQSLT